MNVLNWISENWVSIIIAASLLIVAGHKILLFARLPQDEKIKNIKVWLLYAVVEAERELGNKTGELKLRWVYDKAIERFAWLSIIVSFETFSIWVDEALEEMKKMLTDNKAVANYIGSGK